mmetsp:Transcript_43026/g.98923  ORF Transcript_43026/g.98923 Transcript_43026/m.98923 type:complete len:1069 (+) Transcript_43026:116-3322(+)
MLGAEDIGNFWLCCALAIAVGIMLAFVEDIPPHEGTGPVAHIDGCAEDFWGLGLLEPLRETFSARPEGVQGVGGFIAVCASFVAALSGLARACYAALCRCKGRKKKPAVVSEVPESTTHEKVQLTFEEEISNYWAYVRLIAMGFFRHYLVHFIAYVFRIEPYTDFVYREKWNNGWVEFYKNHCYSYIEHNLHRPIASAPDAIIDVVKLTRKGGTLFGPINRILQVRSELIPALNLSSYNYLGFGGMDNLCTPTTQRVALEQGFSTSASRSEGGTVDIHRELEKEVAEFLSKEDAIVLGMGFATNSTILPALFEASAGGSGILVLSDALNHKSIVEGIRLSGAVVKSFEHNSMVVLEQRLKDAVVKGQDGAGKPWRKIFVVVEGIYSMEGDFCRLREIVALKKKYKAYLYLDEAHSIGAVGPSGRGVTELLGVATSEVDIMMGTFTKSFGSAGGYVAASKDVIAALRCNAPGMLVACAMAPPCAAQALAALRVVTGKEGGDAGAQKLAAIRNNANLFRRRLEDGGFKILGDYDSPIVPMMIQNGFKLRNFADITMERGIAVVVVGYPVVPLLYERARFCISAAHTTKQINDVVDEIVKLGHELGIIPPTQDPNVVAERRKKDARYSAWLHEAPLDVGTAPEVAQWTPEPLVPEFKVEGLAASLHDAITTIETVKPDADFRKYDLLGYGQTSPEAVKDAIVETMKVYGFGACGPRGFYGGMLPHYDLEAAIAGFLGVHSSIVYSSGVVTASSVLPALVKETDYVIVDEEVHMGMRAGLRLAKSNISWYRQGDVKGIESILISLKEKREKELKKKKRSSDNETRTFIIAEGVSQRTGQLAPLPELCRLKEKYGALIILDESLSIPTLGATGRGLCEHFGVKHEQVDAIMGSLEHGFANVGGFCAGRERLVEHQRLAGAGYCYSAASPPSSSAAVTATLKCIDTADGTSRLERLRTNTAQLHEVLKGAISGRGMPLELISDTASPVQLLRWAGTADAEAEEKLLGLSKACAQAGVPLQLCSPSTCKAESSFNKRIGAPQTGRGFSLRAFASASHTGEQIAALGAVLTKACRA